MNREDVPEVESVETEAFFGFAEAAEDCINNGLGRGRREVLQERLGVLKDMRDQEGVD